MKRIALCVLIALLGVTTMPAAAQGETYTCTVDLLESRATCDSRWVKMLSLEEPDRGVVQVTLAPESGFDRVRFTLEYGEAVNGWTFHLGDSISNDGYRGDISHQQNDAEMHIANGVLSVYGRDGVPNDVATILQLNDFVKPFDVVQIVVADQMLGWMVNGQSTGTLRSNYLFALNGQADDEGPVNYDVYAAFNQVITGREDRRGSGLQRVTIELLPPPN